MMKDRPFALTPLISEMAPTSRPPKTGLSLKAAGPIRSKCDNHRTWRGASSGMLCLSINMKFGPAHKPESERALWPAASSGGAWNSLLGSELLERSAR